METEIRSILKMNKQIIIARCNEDTSWTEQVDFADVIIYNKGQDKIHGAIPLPNVGRESGTYLRFIIDNYDSLKKDSLYLFLQGYRLELRVLLLSERGLR